ncbi:KamA family radical SAM protein [Bacteroidota bacterium]
MTIFSRLDNVAISVRARHLLSFLLNENPKLEDIMRSSSNITEAIMDVRAWALEELKKNPAAFKYYKNEKSSRRSFNKLEWKDYAAIRILDYIDNAGRVFKDQNLRGARILSNPFTLIWLATNRGTGGAKPEFFEDTLHLFRQFTGKNERKLPSKEKIVEWMERHPSGLDPRVIKLREENKDRIINTIIELIDKGEYNDSRYYFEKGLSREQKFVKVLAWWDDRIFHLRFAVRNPAALNEMLGYSLDPDIMRILRRAHKSGIPFFINPYYLSLLLVKVPGFAIGADTAIRDYIIYSKQLIKEYGNIVAWEKEDIVEPGKPNAAGWILPLQRNIHRRYPHVAILIPSTVGRACGGLCTSCQRMYDFQNGHLNFDLEKLRPKESWNNKLVKLMDYFENDSQLRDILITGGDALMSSDKSLQKIFDAICEMAERKVQANKKRKDGDKYAEIVRIRLGTRLPVYLPQRITKELIKILRNFKERASKIGIKQFVIQTHFETAMEITPESREAIGRFISAGWIVVNQNVFTTGASRRGHSNKLRKVLNEIGVLTYYTFTVKGYRENNQNFATNGRAVQEQIEEKVLGKIPKQYYNELKELYEDPSSIQENIKKLKEKARLPFLATDRNVLNLPGVGKSLTYRVIGITRNGRRILEFEYDLTRHHSPIIDKMGKYVIIESKSVSDYLNQLMMEGEDLEDYTDLYGYSLGSTEPRMPIYQYPEYDYNVTEKFTNLEIPE